MTEKEFDQKAKDLLTVAVAKSLIGKKVRVFSYSNQQIPFELTVDIKDVKLEKGKYRVIDANGIVEELQLIDWADGVFGMFDSFQVFYEVLPIFDNYKYIRNLITGEIYQDEKAYWSRDSKLNTHTGEFIFITDPSYKESIMPTLNDLKLNNTIEFVDETEIGSFHADTASEASAKAKEKFNIDIPADVFQRNIDAWSVDQKFNQIYDKFYIYNPCGCNRLRFDIGLHIDFTK